jgi:hypothetical protein
MLPVGGKFRDNTTGGGPPCLEPDLKWSFALHVDGRWPKHTGE